ncbi:DNA cytosine methyltransferase [Parasedimentitalea psychrophila]|uniref:Cytosine-specific methyltransferase n=1 Tax=Parasedimentitalea psychrophila TaxID=2997337 RepID=A0A9Y2KZZ0_9RHOB|nr:DNA cytosine methyltransferase [Parasedimentitalea psychrophila]WIY25539.1 DNA cytosine methyltransferase [Parasedimentitalea psychrophila]
MLTSVELCAGAGGQALGLEKAGFDHTALVEIDKHCCATLRHNRPAWNVLEEDVRLFKERASDYAGIDLLAGGLPCPPFSVAGKQLGEKDERNLFDDALDIVDASRPKAVMIENVRGFLDAVFLDYREKLKKQLGKLGYTTDWRLLNASDYGVPQLRPRVVIIALRKEYNDQFCWPDPLPHNPATVGETLIDLMKARGWRGADEWMKQASEIAPTIVGGSKKHGGPDLGPTRSRKAWASLGVEGRTIAPEAPDPFHNDMPRLTVRMVARLQGFPDDWHFTGAKTNAYKQVGNAFPPPVAQAVATQLKTAIAKRKLHAVRA